jgi:predicted kinase
MARLIIFTGHAGVGKTTLSKMAVQQLHVITGESFFLLDKDTVYSAYSAKVMGLITGDPHDRDSPAFLDNLRQPEYDGLLDIARENLSLGVNVVICAPFSQEVKSKKIFDVQALGLPANTRIHVAWITIDEDLARQRIVSRGDKRDRYKLAHWDSYRKRRFEPDAKAYPELSIFDNTTFDTAKFAVLVTKLAAV